MTYYVKPESLIDREAFSRATSVYLVDRTIPMLPERLCNQICSLRPNEEKLCFSVIFELNKNAEIQQSHITRTIIKSDRRFTYEEAQAVIETGRVNIKKKSWHLTAWHKNCATAASRTEQLLSTVTKSNSI